ncbi:g5832 [Coccomyxa viridis]|uniref:G5832 protein n=1 Tax=Coccomyxa viridis TaxID=1274662 RepID=A0ABP1FYQ8_9CHLO
MDPAPIGEERVRLFRNHTTGGLISALSMTPPDTPPGRRARGATEGDEATKLLLPQGPLSAAGSGELGIVSPRSGHRIPSLQRYYMVTIFTLTASLLYADQNLMAPNLSIIAEEFGFNEEEKTKYLGGYIAAAFFAVGAPAALCIGYLCDKMNRRNLLFAVVLLGEGPCLATYFVRRYWQLLLLRVMTGISVGGTFPLVFSLIGDLFSVKQRANVAAGVQVATGIGFAAGQAIAGFVGPHAGWRWPFVIVALPAILAAILMVLTTREPERGATEDALKDLYAVEGFSYQEKISVRKLKLLASNFSTVFAVLQGLPGSLPWGVLLTFLNDFLSQHKGMSISQATLVMTVWGLGGGVGVVGGGAIGQCLHNRRRYMMPLFAGACVASAAFPTWFLINADVGHMPLAVSFAAGFVGGMLASPPGPNARATLLNVNEPEVRGVALALQTVLDDLGKGLGPLLVSLMVSAWGSKSAFNVAVGGWIPCGICFAMIAPFLAKEEDALQERLRDKVHLQTVRILEREDALTPRMEDAGEEAPRHTPRPPARGGEYQLALVNGLATVPTAMPKG